MNPRQGEQWYSKLFRIVNSAACFLLAYILITYSSWFVTAVVAAVYKLNSFVYYYGIRFILNNHSWNAGKITAIYTAGPLWALFVGVFSLLVYRRVRKLKTIANVFLIWAFVIGTSIFAAQIIFPLMAYGNFDSPYYQSLAVVFAWLHISRWVIYFLLIVHAILLLFLAVNYGKPFLGFSYSYSKVNRVSKRRRYFLETVIVPFLLGGLLSTAITYPMNLYIHMVYLSTIGTALIVSWLSLSYIKVFKDEVARFKDFQVLNYFFIMLTVLVSGFVILTFRGGYI